MTLLSSSIVGFSYHANHPTKVVCITGRADADEKDLEWNESERNRFYYHSNRDYCQEIQIDVVPGQDSRLFCRVTDLANETVYYSSFMSSSFVLRCINCILLFP